MGGLFFNASNQIYVARVMRPSTLGYFQIFVLGCFDCFLNNLVYHGDFLISYLGYLDEFIISDPVCLSYFLISDLGCIREDDANLRYMTLSRGPFLQNPVSQLKSRQIHSSSPILTSGTM